MIELRLNRVQAVLERSDRVSQIQTAQFQPREPLFKLYGLLESVRRLRRGVSTLFDASVTEWWQPVMMVAKTWAFVTRINSSVS